MIPLLLGAAVLGAADADFYAAQHNYRHNNFQIARVFFEKYIEENPGRALVPEAEYNLVRIFDHYQDFLGLFQHANRYLHHDRYGSRASEILNLLLARLIERQSYVIAWNYLTAYDYLSPDSQLTAAICLQLIASPTYSDAVWRVCPKTDTFFVLRARIARADERADLYRRMNNDRGALLLCEHFLGLADTLQAYKTFRTIAGLNLDPAMRYRLAKIQRLFDRPSFLKTVALLEKYDGYEKKAALLRALETGTFDARIVPGDAEEFELWRRVRECDTLATVEPDNIDVDSLLADTAGRFERIAALRKSVRDNFYLDSLYCTELLARNRAAEAYAIINNYRRFVNKRPFIRRLKFAGEFASGRYRRALESFRLLPSADAGLLLAAGSCMETVGEDPQELYRRAVETAPDSVIRHAAFELYARSAFARARYGDVAAYPFALCSGDSALVEIYAASLLRAGNRHRADSLYLTRFQSFGAGYRDHYAEYLIENKEYGAARAFYDSLAARPPAGLEDKTHFNRALVCFLQKEFAAAESLFQAYRRDYRRHLPRRAVAAFKIATIKYLNSDFDSAGYYYETAAADSSPWPEALTNALVAWKKAEEWSRVTALGERLLALPGVAHDAILFEMGYACLRRADTRRAISRLQEAIADSAKPEYHYWIAEAYLGKGDFLRALYHYQSIVNKFPKDEMWYPTAEFKSGLALELNDSFDDAKKIYRSIIAARGRADVWGAEAAKRLELLDEDAAD